MVPAFAGRKKGVANFKTDLEDTLQLSVQLSEAGKTKRVSTQQAALARLKQTAVAGDGRALDQALKLVIELDDEAGSSGATGQMDAVDHAILTAFIEEILSSHLDAMIPGDQDAADAPASGHESKGSNR